MYPYVLIAHSLLRWAVIALGILAAVSVLGAGIGARRRVAPFVIALDLQLILGMLLWLWLSPVTALRGGALANPETRHFTMVHPGVGLAAPQLGEAMQACVIEVESHLYELVNPRIVRSSGDDRDLEGCLSIPGYVAYVTRRERVWVVAQDRHGRRIKVAGSGLLGRALQHELDHLEGKLYIDYLDSMDELMAVGAGNEDDAEVREATSALA